MQTSRIETATPDELASVLLSALQRLGQLGREGAVALARLVADDDADFDEANGSRTSPPAGFGNDPPTAVHLLPPIPESPVIAPGFRLSGVPQ